MRCDIKADMFISPLAPLVKLQTQGKLLVLLSKVSVITAKTGCGSKAVQFIEASQGFVATALWC